MSDQRADTRGAASADHGRGSGSGDGTWGTGGATSAAARAGSGAKTTTSTIGAVVLAHGDEPILHECLDSLLATSCKQVVLVDNGYSAPQPLPDDPRLTVVRPGFNTGFTGGCNLGAQHLADECDVVVFINSDLVVRPGALDILADALQDPAVGLVCGLVVLYDDPARIHSVGLPVHYSMFAWAGRWGELAHDVVDRVDVASAAGALMAMRAADWRELGGLYEPLFAYGEDVELSLRVWQRGMRVVMVPEAVGLHAYEFARNPRKFFLLERNRLHNLLTLYDAATLRALWVPLVALEAAICAGAAAGGWLPEKLRAYRWIWGQRHHLAERRALVQRERVVDDAELLPLLAERITPSEGTGVRVPAAFNEFLATCGRRARRRLAQRRTGRPAQH